MSTALGIEFEKGRLGLQTSLNELSKVWYFTREQRIIGFHGQADGTKIQSLGVVTYDKKCGWLKEASTEPEEKVGVIVGSVVGAFVVLALLITVVILSCFGC